MNESPNLHHPIGLLAIIPLLWIAFSCVSPGAFVDSENQQPYSVTRGVLLGPSGDPVGNVEVHCLAAPSLAQGGEREYMAVTDADGSFAIPLVSVEPIPWDYAVIEVARLGPWSSFQKRVDLGDEAGPWEPLVLNLQARASFSFRILDEASEPLAQVFAVNGSQVAGVDAEGLGVLLPTEPDSLTAIGAPGYEARLVHLPSYLGEVPEIQLTKSNSLQLKWELPEGYAGKWLSVLIRSHGHPQLAGENQKGRWDTQKLRRQWGGEYRTQGWTAGHPEVRTKWVLNPPRDSWALDDLVFGHEMKVMLLDSIGAPLTPWIPFSMNRGRRIN